MLTKERRPRPKVVGGLEHDHERNRQMFWHETRKWLRDGLHKTAEAMEEFRIHSYQDAMIDLSAWMIAEAAKIQIDHRFPDETEDEARKAVAERFMYFAYRLKQ